MAGRKRTPDEIPRECITQTDAAARLGITRQAIGAWLDKEGAPIEVDERGQRWVVWPDFARWRENMLVDREARALAMQSDLEFQRARKTRMEADLVELELNKQRGALVALTDFESALATILQRLTSRLRALPPRLQNFGAEVEAAAETEVEHIVDELHAWDEDVADTPDDEDKAA